MNSESRALENLETELKKYDEIIKHLEELISNFEENLIQHTFNLNELKKDIDDQLLRLQKKTYEIAVVGTEKAGKSSLLNAWIGFGTELIFFLLR
jgi:tRNA U34 5-carboxymethylaminomethyl modifying GTPase MnmE/TrmE